MKRIALIVLMLVNVAQAQHFNLIPSPKHIQVKSDKNVHFRNVAKSKKVTLNPQLKMADEAYRLLISNKGIAIEARTQRGVVWAEQTLTQLKQPDGSYPQIEIWICCFNIVFLSLQ